MAGSLDGQETASASGWYPAAQASAPGGSAPGVAAPLNASHPPTEVSPPRPSPPPSGGAVSNGAVSNGAVSMGGSQQIVRYGPGVPGPAPGAAPVLSAALPAAPAAPTAEEVWRHGLNGSRQRRPRPLLRWLSPALSVILLIASAVVIYLRLHYPPLGVNEVAITGVTSGCTVDVTGRISTNGGSGVISYEWTFQPQLIAPQPMSQSVAAGQSAVYVTAAIDGQQHGSLAQTVTLRVLGPGAGRAASARAVISC